METQLLLLLSTLEVRQKGKQTLQCLAAIYYHNCFKSWGCPFKALRHRNLTRLAVIKDVPRQKTGITFYLDLSVKDEVRVVFLSKS